MSESYHYLSPWNPQADSFVPPVQVVSCFIQCGDKFLILQRAKQDEQYMLWGIPGGKLEKNEVPEEGLSREIFEETCTTIKPSMFKLLGTAISKTSCDGLYGLYVYYVALNEKPVITITAHEHHAYKWVTLPEFESTPLLTAQFEAYRLVKESLTKIMGDYENYATF